MSRAQWPPFSSPEAMLLFVGTKNCDLPDVVILGGDNKEHGLIENEMPQSEWQKLVRQVKVLNCGTEVTLMVLKMKQWFH